MVRVLSALAAASHARRERGRKRARLRAIGRFSALIFCTLCAGCAIAPRSRLDECQRLSQTLRTENARLKDRVLAFQSQNRDYADRAVDDARRLAIQDDAIERLEHSVQVYQDERAKLEAAYRELRSSLISLGPAAEEGPRHGESDRQQLGNRNLRASARSSKDITAGDDE